MKAPRAAIHAATHLLVAGLVLAFELACALFIDSGISGNAVRGVTGVAMILAPTVWFGLWAGGSLTKLINTLLDGGER